MRQDADRHTQTWTDMDTDSRRGAGTWFFLQSAPRPVTQPSGGHPSRVSSERTHLGLSQRKLSSAATELSKRSRAFSRLEGRPLQNPRTGTVQVVVVVVVVDAVSLAYRITRSILPRESQRATRRGTHMPTGRSAQGTRVNFRHAWGKARECRSVSGPVPAIGDGLLCGYVPARSQALPLRVPPLHLPAQAP
jgi:hypothetical protein